MKKNVASQIIGAEMVTAADGTAFTGAITCYYTIDGGTQTIGSVGSGICTHEGNGFHTYTPTAGETNGDHIAWTFIGTGAVPATIQVYTTFPQSGDVAIVATEERLAELDAANLPADIDSLILTGTRDIILQYYETGGTTPMPGVEASVYNSDQSKFLGRKTTDVNGQIAIGREDETYKIIGHQAGTVFANVPETIVVTQDETFILYGEPFSVPLPGNPDACNVVCDLLDLGLAAKEGVDFTISLKSSPQGVNSAVLEASELTQTTNANGRTIFTVAQGFKYEIVSPALGEDERVVIDTTGVSSIVLGDEI